MPLTDSYNQGVPYPTLTDKPNIQTAFQALVEALTAKAILSYPSAIVRGASITKPIAGMQTWLQDVGRMEVYDGTAWQRVGPQTAASSVSVSFTNQASYVVWVPFTTPFSGTPTVTTNINSPSGVTARWHSRAYGVTNAGFNLFLFASDGSGTEKATWSGVIVHWQATAVHGTTT
ncbi:hypothetical protein ACWGA9_06165 [Streptomyces sp. NPDC054950]